MKIKEDKLTYSFRFFAYVVVALASFSCLFPFLLIISASFTQNDSIVKDGFHFIPKHISMEGYNMVFRFPTQVLKAYGVTTFVTITGTILGLFLMTMAGYVLARKDFKYRNYFSFYIYFTTLFGGGLVPWYILLTKYMKLTDSYTVLIYPGLMTPFLIILMKNFIKSTVPDELYESAKIDGANDFTIYSRIVLHLSMPGIATVGLFLALQYWNDWFMSALFINDQSKYQLQFYLYNVINSMQFIAQMGVSTGVSIGTDLPAETTKMSMAIIVTGPVLLLYPFVQRFFVKGLTIGAVKG